MKRIPPFKMLDAFRGFAAAWVVATHCCSRFIAGDNLHFVNQPLYAFSIRGQLGVVLFFVISGYCITAAAVSALLKNKPLWRYAYERVRRIYPPYLAALVIGIVASLGVFYANAHHLIPPVNHLMELNKSPVYWLANLFLLQSELATGFVNIVFWSLCFEVAFYVIVGCWLWLAKRVLSVHGTVSGVLTLFLGIAGTTFIALLTLIKYESAIFPFGLWHQFALGGLLFFALEVSPDTIDGFSRNLKVITYFVTAMVLILVVVYAALRPGVERVLGHPSSRVCAITCVLFFTLLMVLRPFDERLAMSKWVSPFLWLGAGSYSLYLIHPVILPFIDASMRRVGFDQDRYWICFLVQWLVALAAGRGFFLLVEKRFISKRRKLSLMEEHTLGKDVQRVSTSS